MLIKEKIDSRQIDVKHPVAQIDYTSKVLPGNVLHRAAAAAVALLITAFCLRLKLDLCRGIAAKMRLKIRKNKIEIKSKDFIETDFASFIASRGEIGFLSCISLDLFATQFLVMSFGSR